MGPQGPQGPQGPRGPTGPKGDDGILDFDILQAEPSGAMTPGTTWTVVGQPRTITVTSTADVLLLGEVSARYSSPIGGLGSLGASVEFVYRVDGSQSGFTPVSVPLRDGDSNTRLMIAKKRLSPGNHQIAILARCTNCIGVSVPKTLRFLALQVIP